MGGRIKPMRCVATTFILILLLICSSNEGRAQRLLSFEDAVETTFEHNPTIKALQSERTAARRTRQAAIGLFMPQVRLRAGYIHADRDISLSLNNDITALLGIDLSYTLQPRNVGCISGDLLIPIFTGGEILAANRAAKTQERISNDRIAQSTSALHTEIVTRYFGYALARQALQVRERVVKTVEQHLLDLRSLERNGMATRTELLYVEARLSQARGEMEDARLEMETLAAALASTLGVKGAVEPVTSAFILREMPPMETYMENIEGRNAMLRIVDGERALARENVKVHRAAFFPEIVGMGALSLYDYNLTSALPRAAIGVGLSFKLFDGLRREYSYAASRHTLRRVESLQCKAIDEIKTLVTQLYNRAQGLRLRVLSLDEGVRAAEQYLRSVRVAYREGVATITQVLDAEVEVARVQIARVEAAYKFDVAFAQLLENTGQSEAFATLMRSADTYSITLETDSDEKN